MKARNFIMILLALGLIGAMTACKGEKGDDGVPGRDGKDGIDGNANVKAYVFETVQGDWNWVKENEDDETYGRWSTTFESAAITKHIVDGGACLVYMKQPRASETLYKLLPLTEYDRYWGLSYTISPIYGEGGVLISWTYSDHQNYGNPCTLASDRLTFKVVLIDGDLLAKNQYEDLSDYSKVEKLFNVVEIGK